MDKDLEKLFSYVIEPQSDDDWFNFDKYPQQVKRFYPTPVFMAWTEDGFNKSIEFAKSKLPPLIRYLPNDFVVKKIKDFITNAYKNPQIVNLSKLKSEFDERHLQFQNIVIKLYNTDIDQDVIKSDLFVLYKPDVFYKNFLEPYLQQRKFDQWNKSLRHVFSYEDLKQPYVILLLKDVVIYEKENDINKNNIVECAEKILNALCVVIGLKYKAKDLGDYFKHSLQTYCLFTRNMEPIQISNIGNFYAPYYREPSYITKEMVNDRIFKLFLHKTKLEEKINKSINWLGKSMITENLDDSFLQVAIALECLLSKSENTLVTPSLTFSLSETLAFLIEKEQKQRINVFNDMKNMYALRSKIVHSGQGNVTFDTYRRFFGYVYDAIKNLLLLLEENHWNHISNLYQYIEQQRFS